MHVSEIASFEKTLRSPRGGSTDSQKWIADAGRSTACVWDSPLDHDHSPRLIESACGTSYTVALAQMKCFELTPAW